MEGIVTVKDTRSNVNAIQQFQAREVANTMQNGESVNIIDGVANTVKSVVSVAGSVLNIAAWFIPGGKIAKVASFLVQPAILGAIEAGKNLLNGIFVNKDQEQICASMSDLAGNVQNITIRDTNLVQTIASRRADKKSIVQPTVLEDIVHERKART